MKILSPNFDYDKFFNKLSSAEKRMLLTDYDGTLAPFTIERDQAFPYPEVIEALKEIIEETNTYVAIISGRAIKDLLPLLKDFEKKPEIWGSHGWEHLSHTGIYKMLQLPLGVKEAIKQAEKQIVSLGLEDRIERKSVSIAVHWRGLPINQASSINRGVRKIWSQYQQNLALEIHSFDGGIELRPIGQDKGTAVQAVVRNSFENATDFTLAYLGDDQTDEDAFGSVGKEGLSVLVRKEHRPTTAALWLKPPEDLEIFFRNWKSACAKN